MLLSFTAQAQYKTLDPADEKDIDAPRFWNEVEIKIPSAPPSKQLKPFFVSINTPLTFAIDAESIELGKDDEPHGIKLFDFREHKPVTNPDTYKLAQAGLWCTVSVHEFSDSRYYKRYWPTLRYVSLINNENFAKMVLPKKNKDITFDTTWSTSGITPRGAGFEFDVDYCIYNTEKFVQQVDQLYKWLEFDDFNADLVADYHRRYIEIH
jgi:hypothetical protein